jgi:hypothetical protein
MPTLYSFVLVYFAWAFVGMLIGSVIGAAIWILSVLWRRLMRAAER